MNQSSFSFAIFFSLIGIGAGLCGVGAGIALSPEAPQFLLQYRGLLILAGGLLALSCMSFSLSEIRQSLALIWEILTGSAEPDREGVLKECLMLATRSRESEGQEMKFYREIKPYLSHLMLQSGVDLLISGYSPEMVQTTLQTQREQQSLKYQTCLQVLQSLMHGSWMLGLMAGASALMRTQLLSSRELLPAYLSGIAVPIVAGLALSVLLFYPLIRQVQINQREWQNYLEMSITGVLLLQARHHALYLETVLKAFLPPLAPQPLQTPPQAKAAAAPGKKRSSFQAALEQEDVETPAAKNGDEAERGGLSVDELRRFRPVQRSDKKPGNPER